MTERILAAVPGQLAIRQRAVHGVPRLVAFGLPFRTLFTIRRLNDLLQVVKSCPLVGERAEVIDLLLGQGKMNSKATHVTTTNAD